MYAIAGHSGPRVITNNLYITDDLSACQNSDHRVRAEQFAHRNDNPHAGQKDGGRLLIVRILSAADVAGKTGFLGENHGIYPKDGNCWIACSGNILRPFYYSQWWTHEQAGWRGFSQTFPYNLELQKPDVFVKSFN